MPEHGDASRRWLVTIARWVLPVAIAVAGAVMIVIGHGRVSARADRDTVLSAAGVALLLVALIVWMINWMFRMSVESNRDRDREEDARRYFEEHGRWPDE